VQFERRTEASALPRASSDPTPVNQPNNEGQPSAEVGDGRMARFLMNVMLASGG